MGGKIFSECDIFGDYPSTLLGVDNVYLKYTKLQFGDDKTLLELIQFKTPKLKPKMSMAHIAFTVENINNLVAKLFEEGISTISIPLHAPENNVKVCFILDPDGNRIELVEELNE
jgi:catechol 2,3-dioxygenase-like lactoylglutathione lyase family enzyme